MHAYEIDLSAGPVLAARRGPGLRVPSDTVLVRPRAPWRTGPELAWIARGKAAPLPSLAELAPLEAFDLRVFVRADRRALVLWRAGPSGGGPGRPDCRWVAADFGDELPVAAAHWADVADALARQFAPHGAGRAA